MMSPTALLLAVLLQVGAPTPPEAQAQEAFTIGKMLRCPVCQGMPIAESPSPMAQDMMARVRSMLAEGQSREAILGYFVERYGEWVLLEPTAKGINWGLWILPGVALVVGLGFVARTFKRQKPIESAAAPTAANASDTLKAIRDEVEL